MRDLLFRGKTKSGMWVYGYYMLTLIRGEKTHVIAPLTSHMDVTLDKEQYIIDPEAVGQYTGMADRNGKDIYEGDIVKVFGMTGKIVQECGAFGIHIEPFIDYNRLEREIPYGNNADFCFNANFISLWELWWNYQQDDEPLEVVEVVGNIHDKK